MPYSKMMVDVYGWSDKLNPIAIPKVLNDSQQRRRGGTIRDFVEQTGGDVFVSKNQPWLKLSALQVNSEFGKEFDELFIKLIGLIRSSYTIGYYPENTNFDGRFRQIKLELSPNGKTKAGKVDIKTRDGYHAMRRATPTAAEINPVR